MKKLLKILIILATVLLCGCEKDDDTNTVTPVTAISFEVEQSNSSNDYTSSVKSASLRLKKQDWRLHHDGKTQLEQSIFYDVTLENGEVLDFGFWFIKYEKDASELMLEPDSSDQLNEKWDYISTEVEASNFYKGFDEARVLINSNVIYHTQVNDGFEVDVEKVTVEGEEKSYVTINFDGTAYGFYDPEGESQEVFAFKNGFFRGVIE